MSEKKKTKADKDVATVVGTPSEVGSSDRHSLLKSRLKVAKAFSKKPHEAWKKWISEYEIDDIDDTAEIRNKVRIGYVFRKTESEVNNIFEDQPDLFFKGRNKKLREMQGLYESAYDLLWDIQGLESKIDDLGVYFELLGMAFIESPYVVKTKKVKELQPQPVLDETGQPVLDESGQPVLAEQEVEYEVPIIDNPLAETVDPFKIHFSPETKFNRVLDYDHCPYYLKEKTLTVDEIKDKYGKDVDADETLHTNDQETNDEIEKELKEFKDDLKRVKVYEYYGVLPKSAAEGIEGEWRYDKDYYVVFTKNEELHAEESPYDTKPCFVLGNYGLANKFWKFGDAKHLMPLIQELEQYRSQILKHTRKMANPKPLVEMNSQVDEDAFNDSRVGKTVKYMGIKPEYLSPANLGREVQVGIDMARTDLEKTAPTFDLAGGGGQSQVRSPRGIQVFSEASDRGVRKKRKKVAMLIRDLMIFQFKQIGMNWEPDSGKTLDVDGEDVPVTKEVLQLLSDDTILHKLDIEIESLTTNRVQQKQDAIELFNIARSNPDIFNKMEMAKDLLQNGYNKKDADRYLVPELEVAKRYIGQFLSQVAGQDPDLATSLIPLLQNFQLVNETGQALNGEPGGASEGAAEAPSGEGLEPLPNV
jgi:hypothetical protein